MDQLFTVIVKRESALNPPIRWVKTLIISALLLSSGISNAQWLTGYDYRKPITIEGDSIFDNLATFPALISFTDADITAPTVTSANGYDIAFTTDDGSTQLDHEIISYNSGTGAYRAWVELQGLVTGVDETIYVYYGNSTVTTDPSTDATWDGDYAGVWHFDESGLPGDATSNGNDASTDGTTVATGFIDGGRQFDKGTSSWIDVPHSASLDITGYQITIEAWVNAEVQTADVAIVHKAASQNQESYMLGFDNGASIPINRRLTREGWPHFRYDDFTVPATTWTHIVMIYDGQAVPGSATANDHRTYIDGVLQTPYTQDPDGDPYGPLKTTTNSLRFGKRTNGNNNTFGGYLDEIRISGIARSDGYIETSHSNQRYPTTFAQISGPSQTNCTTGTITAPTTQVPSGNTQTLTITGHDVAATLTWQSSADNITFSDIASTNNATYTTAAITTRIYYRVKQDDGDCIAYSESIAISPFDNTFCNRKLLTIDQSMVSGSSDLSNFPVLISVTDPELKSTANGGLVENANGWDIAFTDTDGVTALDHQIDGYDATTGEYRAWVKIPTLQYDENTELYLYFSDASVAADPSTDNVFSNNYLAVYHLDSDFINRGGANYDGTNNGTTSASGKIGGAREFDGTNDYIDLGSGTILIDGRDAHTISGWIYIDGNPGTSDHWGIYSRSDSYGPAEFSFDIGTYGGTDTKLNTTTQTGTSESDSEITRGTWMHVAVAYDNASNVTYYINGVAEGPFAYSEPTAVAGVAQTISFGNPTEGQYFDGLIDELHFSDAERSGDWVVTEYNNQNNPAAYISFSGIESILAGGTATASSTAINNGETVTMSLAGHDGGATIVWQSSTDNATFTSTGETASFFISPGLNQTTYYRAEIDDGSCTTFSNTVTINVSGNFLAGYCNRKKLTIDADQVGGSTDLTDFPVLVSITDKDLRTVANAGLVENANGWDIAFAAADGNTALAFELESYDGTTGAYVGWVKLPTVSATLDTDFYIYFGDATAASDPSVTSTWNSDYLAVWHLDGNVEDATGSNTVSNAVSTSNATGQIGDGFSFDGSNSRIDTDTDYLASMRTSNSLTLSGWVYPTDSDDGAILGQFEFSSGEKGFLLWRDIGDGGDGFAMSVTTDTQWERVGLDAGVSNLENNWHYVVGTWDGTIGKVFVDGQLNASLNISGNMVDTSVPTKSGIGVNEDGLNGRNIAGLMDELRISQVARSDGWIETEYNNQNDPASFLTIGSLEGTVTAGTASAADTTIMGGETADLTLTGYQGGGIIDWQSCTDGCSWVSTGGTTASYTSIALNETTYFRAVVSNGTCSMFSNTVIVSVTAAFANGYCTRKSLTIDNTKVSGSSDLTDFPLLVSLMDEDLRTTANGGLVDNVNGYDIVFTDNTGTNQLAHQIESYDPTTGEFVAWVKVNSLSASIDTQIYMYFGKTGAADPSSTLTFSGVYDAVYHLNDYTSATGIFDGNGAGHAPTASDGKVGPAQFFDGVDDYLDLSNTTLIDGRSSFALSAWVLTASAPPATMHYGIYARYDPTTNHGSITFDLGNYADTDDTRINLSTNNSGTWNTYNGNTQTDLSSWQHLAVVYNDGTGQATFYLNGVADGSVSMTQPSNDTPIDQYLGAGANSDQYFHGLLDEVRLADQFLSGDWITTEYNNTNDPTSFYTVGELEYNGTGGTIAATDNILDYGLFTTLSIGGYSGSVVNWQSSENNENFTDIGAATADDYTTGNLTETTYYRVSINDGTCTYYSNVQQVNVRDEFTTGYTYRKQLSIDPDNVSGTSDLTDFPLLVSFIDPDFRSTGNGGRVANVNGWDIRFAGADGVSFYDYQMESYDNTTGTVVAWVSIPTVYANATTEFYVYFGNCDATLTNPSTSGTWGAEYAGVWHFEDDPTTTVLDGTSNDNDGAGVNGFVAGDHQTGKIGMAFEWDNTGKLIRIPDDNSLDLVSSMTLSAWIKPYSLAGGFDGIIDKLNAYKMFINVTGSEPFPGFRRIKAGTVTKFGLVPLDIPINTDWHLMTVVFDDPGDVVKFFLDGVQVGPDVALTSVPDPSSDALEFGAEGTTNDFFHGMMDEIRIISETKSADWIQTEYNNQNDPSSFYAVGDLEGESQWTGQTNQLWSVGSNWSNCEVPENGVDIRVTDVANDPILDQDATVGTLILETNSLLVHQGSQELTLEGSLRNNGTNYTPGTGTTSFAETNVQFLSGSATHSFNTLNLNKNSSSLKLYQPITVSGPVTLNGGFLELLHGGLTVLETGSIVGGTTGSFIVTNGTECLMQEGIGTTGRITDIIYPVGIDTTSYTPATLNNGTGDKDDFCVRVIGGAYEDGATGDRQSSNVVDRTWLIDETSDGGSNVTLTLQWNTGEDLNGFDRASAFISHYDDSNNWWETLMAANTATPKGGGAWDIGVGGVANFSPFGVGSGSTPLPITLVYFTANAEGGEVITQWETITEVNNDYFTVERSKDLLEWEVIGTVAGNGSTHDSHQYQLVDSNPLKGKSYYRLKQTDFNGLYSYQEPVLVENYTFDNPGLNVYPNPSDGTDFVLQLSDFEADNLVSISLMDLNGRLMAAKSFWTDTSGQLEIKALNKKPLDSGVYMIEAKMGDKKVVKRLIVK